MTAQRETAPAPERVEAASGTSSIAGVDCFGNCRGQAAAVAFAVNRIFQPLERRQEAAHGRC